MNNIVGYALIKKDAKRVVSTINPSKFLGQIVRVIEFAESELLVIDNESTGLASFNKEDIQSEFKCEMFAHFLCPPNLNLMEKIQYSLKCSNRKGGYNDILKQMIITASIAEGKFYDSFLWQKQ